LPERAAVCPLTRALHADWVTEVEGAVWSDEFKLSLPPATSEGPLLQAVFGHAAPRRVLPG